MVFFDQKSLGYMVSLDNNGRRDSELVYIYGFYFGIMQKRLLTNNDITDS